jgi:hypothetical protein
VSFYKLSNFVSFLVDRWIRVFLEKFPGISYFTDLRLARGVEKISHRVLKARLKIKETTYTLVFRKYLVVSF